MTDNRPDAMAAMARGGAADRATAEPAPADGRTPTRMILLLISAWDWLDHLTGGGRLADVDAVGDLAAVRGLVAEIGAELHRPVERTHRLVPVDLLRRVADEVAWWADEHTCCESAPDSTLAELRATLLDLSTKGVASQRRGV